MDEEMYDKIWKECKDLAISRNKAYGDSYKVCDVHTLTGLVIMKLTRIYRLGDSAKTMDELQDAINYLAFSIEKLKKGEPLIY